MAFDCEPRPLLKRISRFAQSLVDEVGIIRHDLQTFWTTPIPDDWLQAQHELEELMQDDTLVELPVRQRD